MTIADIQTILKSTPGTLSQARRIFDFVRGSLPTAKPAASTGPLASLTQEQVDSILDEHQRTGAPVLDLLARSQGYNLTPAPGTAKTATRSTAAPAATAPTTLSETARLAACRTRVAAQDRALAELKPRVAALEAKRRAQLAAAGKSAPAAAPARPAAARPAPVRATPPPAAPRPSAPSASAAAIAAALLDEQERRAAAALVKTRAQFDLLTARQAAAFFKAGGKLID